MGSKREVEIKLSLPSAADGRRLLRQAGFRVIRRRVYEDNLVFDTPQGQLRSRSLLLRLRAAGSVATLTFKGPPSKSRFKSRFESETKVSDPAACREILHRLGYRQVYRYEKYRTEYRGKGDQGVVALDETPIGVFFELEGSPAWIDATAGLLGFGLKSYISESYMALHQSYRRRLGLPLRAMVFPLATLDADLAQPAIPAVP
jgi:adenylate cyclase class 2